MPDERIVPTEVARAIAAQRKPKERTCPVCGKTFVTIGRGLYDTEQCAWKAAYYRRRDRQVTADASDADPTN